jgi:DNA-binding NtrC family response regulator
MSSGPVVDEAIFGLAEEMDSVEGEVEITADMTLKDMERELILRKLRKTAGNRTQAAQELGISVRTLRNKLHLYHELGVKIPG